MKIVDLDDIKHIIPLESSLVLAHGCFDILHYGHIRHLQAAKNMGNTLLVTVTPDQYVNKGEGRPVFGEKIRAECLGALECVDYVSINKWESAEKTLKLIMPLVYVKGMEAKNNPTENFQREIFVANGLGIDVKFTDEVVFSTTDLVKHF